MASQPSIFFLLLVSRPCVSLKLALAHGLAIIIITVCISPLHLAARPTIWASVSLLSGYGCEASRPCLCWSACFPCSVVAKAFGMRKGRGGVADKGVGRASTASKSACMQPTLFPCSLEHWGGCCHRSCSTEARCPCARVYCSQVRVQFAAVQSAKSVCSSSSRDSKTLAYVQAISEDKGSEMGKKRGSLLHACVCVSLSLRVSVACLALAPHLARYNGSRASFCGSKFVLDSSLQPHLLEGDKRWRERAPVQKVSTVLANSLCLPALIFALS